ncbi:HD domain-containing protein [Cohnella fermenti]|uniref:HD domain-containing protein n=1 Tax=Cohnella fermenti TaxID=2565925 RepID=A0A4S4BXP4_9BACL|nr:HD domain-containing protein [Cohnella fermenti]THF79477.1 HD domain-containing protein [Cohnella fermenti]
MEGKDDVWGTPRLTRQIAFLMEIDRLKTVLRRTVLTDGSRRENTAEHSWHIAMMAMTLHEYVAEPKPDLSHTIKLLLVHDIVEIDAGDTFAYDTQGYSDKEEREQAAASRIFGLLEEDQAAEYRKLWREFEEMDTREALFAAAIDRLQPMLHNYYTEGYSWKENGVRHAQALRRIGFIDGVSPVLASFIQELLQRAVDRGFLES